jgi:RES domain-containing protein
MLEAWRITKSRNAGRAFDGEGSRLYGSRWTSRGLRVAHASQSLSLATLEVLVHLQSSTSLGSYSVFRVRIPEDLAAGVNEKELPSTWRRFPAPPEVQAIGDRWLREARSAVLRVPSAIVPHEHNYLINPEHGGFKRIKIQGPLKWDVDPRIFSGKRDS